MASLAEIRAKLASMESRSGSNNSTQSDKAIYPFWNIDEGTTCVLRFLPDDDPNNTFFWVERQMIRLTFPGVLGGEQKPVTVQVPCMEMWGDTCPVLTEVRPWFKDPSLEDMGRKYWKKRSYIFQGFVKENPLNGDELPDNPIRRFVIGPQIFNIIKSALMDPEMENLPIEYVNGCDFRLSKTTKGQYADYSTSKWSRNESALDEEQLAAVDTNGLFNLADFLPTKPGADGVQAIAEMFQASVDGELYDPAKWGSFYKPYGLQVASSQTQSTVAPAQPATNSVAPATETVVETPVPVTEPVVETPAPAPVTASADTGKKSADDILNMIRNRQSS